MCLVKPEAILVIGDLPKDAEIFAGKLSVTRMRHGSSIGEGFRRGLT